MQYTYKPLGSTITCWVPAAGIVPSDVNVPAAAATEYSPIFPSPLLATYAKRAFAAATVNVAVPVKAVPSFAVIVDVPTPTPKATPVVALMVAVVVVPEVNVTGPAGVCNVASLHFSFTEKATELLTAMVGARGVNTRDTGPALKTVSVVLPVAPPNFALIRLVPPAIPVARPVAVIVATVVVPAVQVVPGALDTSMVAVVPSAFVIVTVATNCCVVFLPIVGVAGVTATETTCETDSMAV